MIRFGHREAMVLVVELEVGVCILLLMIQCLVEVGMEMAGLGVWVGEHHRVQGMILLGLAMGCQGVEWGDSRVLEADDMAEVWGALLVVEISFDLPDRQ